ncbi:hypothetical protein ACHZ97_04265 [Lysobacter soli]|uniref:head-tail joining protein n=1 Tax=Lysobacter soli TaxID=453783 RepID=UPI0037C61725
MGQVATLRALDAAIVSAFANAGMADAATYTPAGGVAVTCTVLVDRAAQYFGDVGEVVGRRIVVSLFLAEVPSPARGGVVTLADGGEQFRLSELDLLDDSISRWVVTHV